jgi:hypothetical protein
LIFFIIFLCRQQANTHECRMQLHACTDWDRTGTHWPKKSRGLYFAVMIAGGACKAAPAAKAVSHLRRSGVFCNDSQAFGPRLTCAMPPVRRCHRHGLRVKRRPCVVSQSGARFTNSISTAKAGGPKTAATTSKPSSTTAATAAPKKSPAPTEPATGLFVLCDCGRLIVAQVRRVLCGRAINRAVATSDRPRPAARRAEPECAPSARLEVGWDPGREPSESWERCPKSGPGW